MIQPIDETLKVGWHFRRFPSHHLTKPLTYLVADGATVSVVDTQIIEVDGHRLSPAYQSPQVSDLDHRDR